MKYLKFSRKILLFFVIVLVLTIALFCSKNIAKAQTQGNGIILATSVDKARASTGNILTFTINYTIGASSVKNAKIEDVIPEGAFYINDSATLNGSAMTDSEDVDKYTFIDNKATWNLGSQTANGKGKVSFQVKMPINLLSYGIAGQGGDDTSIIQTALNDTATKGQVLYIPSSTSPYIVKPLTIPTNTKLLLGSGAVIQAAPGYLVSERVISVRDAQNVTIMGYGAKVQMPKAEYMTDADKIAGSCDANNVCKYNQWRHGVGIYGSNNVSIYGLASNSSGGDGFYIGETAAQSYSGNVKLIDCLADNNIRQGLSVISAKDLLVKRCRFTNTNGTAPQAGIDMEPNYAHDQLTNINVEDCITSDNVGYGVVVSLHSLDTTSPPVSINVLRNTDSNTTHSYMGYKGRGVKGTVNFTDCESLNAQYYGAIVSGWETTGPQLTFTNTTIKNANQILKTVDHAAVYVTSLSDEVAKIGNIQFTNTMITGTSDKLWYYFTIHDSIGVGIGNLKYTPGISSGALNNPYGLQLGNKVISVNIL